MALKDIVDRIDAKFEELFHRKPFDAEAARKPLLAKIESTKTQFASGQPSKGRGKWYEIGHNSQVAFTPVLPTGQPLMIGGKTTTFWPSAEFPMILDLLTKSVNKGELDKELENDRPGDAASITPTKVRKARGPLSTEKLEARRAKMAANGTTRKRKTEA